MHIHTAGHLFGETIIEHAFPLEYRELMEVLESIEPPLRAAGPFTDRGRPPTPKRQARTIGGSKRQFLLPVDQVEMNRVINDQLRVLDWQTQPFATGDPAGTPLDRYLRGDFHKNRIFVEVEFGNTASMFRDLFKFQIAGRSRQGDVGVLIVATAKLARFFDSGVATFEQAVSLLPYMRIGIQLPVWVIGLEPFDWGPIGIRYEEMRSSAEAQGVSCHDFASAFGAPLPVVEELPRDDESKEGPDEMGSA